MALRLEDVGRIGITLAALVVSCSSEDGGSGGTAGSGGMVGAGTSSGGTSASGSSAGGASSGGTSASGSSAGGASSGGSSASGASAGGAGGTTGGGGASSGTGGGSAGSAGSGGGNSKTSFFVSSDTSMTGKLGGLTGADKRCQDLAQAAGIGERTFHAYLSTSTVNAKDRIGSGPWVNAKGLTVAESVAELHSTVKGDETLFIDEKGMAINGQWNMSMGADNEHDILTGTKADGTVSPDKTCMDWTSDSSDLVATVGHSDGLGPQKNPDPPYDSWNSSHDNESCANTTPRGGKGRIYCFAID
ncbi:MAG: hypothetical protein EOO73_27750 [Myxococcales bacterium]|nr:MAG: hypothetical protein EOO73_27750 [Myxococcales bacterium]